MKSKLCLLLMLVLLFSNPALSATVDWPKQTVTIIVPFDAGGAIDIPARILADYLMQELGGTFVVENRPGAQGILALNSLLSRPADGNTMSIITTPTGPWNLKIMAQTPVTFEPDKDFTVLGATSLTPAINGIFVNSNSPYQTFPELIRAIQAAAPGTFNVGLSGPGSSVDPMWMELEALFGIKCNVVYYPGSTDIQTAILTGDVHLGVAGLLRPQIIDNPGFRIMTMFARGVPANYQYQGQPYLPDFQQELGFNYETLKYLPLDSTIGGQWPIFRAGTDPRICELMTATLKKISERPDYIEQMKATGAMIQFLDPVESVKRHRNLAEAMKEWKALTGN